MFLKPESEFPRTPEFGAAVLNLDTHTHTISPTSRKQLLTFQSFSVTQREGGGRRALSCVPASPGGLVEPQAPGPRARVSNALGQGGPGEMHF